LKEFRLADRLLKQKGVGDYLFIVVLSTEEDGEPTYLCGDLVSNSFAATA
jgi:hypothetical protein